MLNKIDYIGILKYLSTTQGVPYSNPEKLGLSEEAKKRFLEIKDRGQEAAGKLKQIAKKCGERYGLKNLSTISWLDGSNTKTRKYLWVQMKYEEYADSPISVSIFVEKGDAKTWYRICLEIKNTGADKKDMLVYHSHLDVPKTEGVQYVAGSNEKGNPKIITGSTDEIKKRLDSGEISKVQPCVYVEYSEDKTNSQYDDEIMAAVEKIIPYYKYVLKKKNSSKKKLSTIYDKNMILYGPPGTGKTYSTAIYSVAICDGVEVDEVRTMDYDAVMKRYRELLATGRIAFTTFHQSYGYEEFIEGIKPVLSDNNIGYTIESGIFKKFCAHARVLESDVLNDDAIDDESIITIPPSNCNCVFIIDEINRGNISKIFGELITLIEDTKREGMLEQASTILPYSKEVFSVPNNVYIIGTMNTADRSIALMDTALRRRFHFIEMMPDADVLRKIGADKVEDLDVAKMLETINERITFLYDREHTIGHAFFTKLAKSPTIETLQSIFKNKIIPLLQEYFYDDYQKIQLVLGDNGKEDEAIKFVIDNDIVLREVFKGNTEDLVDLPEKRYIINENAFENIDSYKQLF